MKDKLFAIGLLLIILCGAAVVYDLKYAARDAGREVRLLEQQITREREAIALLKAEWSLLSRPERIQKLVERFSNDLELVPLKSDHFGSIDDLPIRTKTKDEDFIQRLIDEAAPEDAALNRPDPIVDLLQ